MRSSFGEAAMLELERFIPMMRYIYICRLRLDSKLLYKIGVQRLKNHNLSLIDFLSKNFAAVVEGHFTSGHGAAHSRSRAMSQPSSA